MKSIQSRGGARKSSQKRETTCGASEQLEVANMGIKMILYVIPMDSNRFQVDTEITSGFAQKKFFRIFKHMETLSNNTLRRMVKFPTDK